MTQTASPLHADRPVLGITLMLGFCVLAPLGDSVAKLLGAVIPILALVTLRFAMQAVFLGGATVLTRRPWRMSPRALRLTFWRTLWHIAGVGMMFWALSYLPLADAVAIAFVMPFIMLLLGNFFLGEEVGPRRLAACAVGFVGTLMVVQPSFVEVGWPALLPLGVAVSFSAFMLCTRQIAKEVDPIAMMGISGVMATAILVPALVLGTWSGLPQLGWQMPPVETWWLLACIGLIGSFGHLLMTWSLRYAPGATLAPMQYLEIPFATLIGWLIFRDFPDGLALAGIAVTMGSGLYIILRERGLARDARRQAAARPEPAPVAPALTPRGPASPPASR